MHAFVAMPYGKKEDIDFNKVYSDYIKPALESAGFEVFRADEELRAGNIRTDMFQELLLADLVVVDLSIDNPNVWYELGVRHALRARGVIQIQCKRDYLPFDVYVDRALRYRVKNGLPDPEYIEEDKKNLAEFAVETMASWHKRKISPVYHLLRFLEEPSWKHLRVDEVMEIWERHKIWEDRIEVAQKGNRPGDVMVLAEEAPTQVLRLEAHRTAGGALVKVGQFKFALEQYEKALLVDPEDLKSRQQKGMLLGRLKKYDEAKEWLENVVHDHPDDAESRALLGRIEKDNWIKYWKGNGKTSEEMFNDAGNEDSLLREAIETYATGFRKDPTHCYSGINAVTLLHLLKHLTGKDEKVEERRAMEGGIRWAVLSALSKRPRDYWARVTLGDLEVLVSDKEAVGRAYKSAVAVADKDWFAVDSSRQQLLLLKDLGFRPPEVETGLNILDRALEKLTPPWKPRLVFLFSGHRIDEQGRAETRFPEKEGNIKIAKEAIAKELDKLGADPEKDLALCGGACGGDLLFAEACLERGLQVEVRIPFDEPKFLKESVMYAGSEWRDGFYKVKDNKKTRLLIKREELGPALTSGNPYSRNNLWRLYTALSWGPEKIRFICLWDGKESHAPGGTKHMYDSVLERSGQVYPIYTYNLW